MNLKLDIWEHLRYIVGFPCGSAGKESSCNAGDLGLIPGLGRSPGEGKGYPLQYSGLENSMNCIVRGVTKRQTQLSDFYFISLQIYCDMLACYVVVTMIFFFFFKNCKSYYLGLLKTTHHDPTSGP